MIPCTYKKCNLPIEYSCYVRADYERDIVNGYFWKKLEASLLPIKSLESKRSIPIEKEGLDKKFFHQIILVRLQRNVLIILYMYFKITCRLRIEDITLEDREPNKNNLMKNAETSVEQATHSPVMHMTCNGKFEENSNPPKDGNIAKPTEKKSQTLLKKIKKVLPGVKTKTKKSKKKQIVYAS